ncbi:hypothetical protein QBC37DRAFT_393152 [Rhypophila decipiens]|uniref:Uncharacterized protein n=1 Tax=Rhypophila decipiens TaxID=261697 RepID=A0AAN7B1K8_9PEZI|nr:hypothetical protein QBC37DRAFT_393152 [Rhypophila decipiens]
MESWKALDTVGSYSPIFALSITAEEWGLKGFPSNLIGIEGTWAIPDDTPSSSSSPNHTTILAWDNQRRPLDTQIILNASDVRPCDGTTLSPWDKCHWIIEDIGRNTTTVGPLDSDLVSLTCCLSALLSIVLTVLIMGCTVSVPKPTASLGPTSEESDEFSTVIINTYNPPAPVPESPQPPPQNQPSSSPSSRSRPIGSIEKAMIQSNTTHDIRRCTALLRDLYSLDLQIWGTEGAVYENEQEGKERVAAMKRQAGDIFDEVRKMVEALHSQSSTSAVTSAGGGDEGVDVTSWTAREKECLMEVFGIIEEQKAARGKGIIRA